jgi:hypothetical protein
MIKKEKNGGKKNAPTDLGYWVLDSISVFKMISNTR